MHPAKAYLSSPPVPWHPEEMSLHTFTQSSVIQQDERVVLMQHCFSGLCSISAASRRHTHHLKGGKEKPESTGSLWKSSSAASRFLFTLI